MIPLAPSIVAWLCFTLSPPSSPTAVSSAPPALPILEVVKVYGKLAGSSCYGRVAPVGSSCQVSATELIQSLGFSEHGTVLLDRDQFADRLEEMPFRWPLKPFGIDKSLDKTALMNKGAETALYMQQLESAGLYDPRNPTGPLPTSLRPHLNARLQQQGLERSTVDRIYDLIAAGGDSKKVVTAQSVTDNLFGAGASRKQDGMLDYYEFVHLLGTESISWEQ